MVTLNSEPSDNGADPNKGMMDGRRCLGTQGKTEKLLLEKGGPNQVGMMEGRRWIGEER